MDEELEELPQDFEKACRLCLTIVADEETTKSSIFEQPPSPVPFVEKIKSCTSVQVSPNDKVTTLICSGCVSNINNWYTYKKVCIYSQKQLDDSLTKSSTDTQSGESVKQEPGDADQFDDNVQLLETESITQDDLSVGDDIDHLITEPETVLCETNETLKLNKHIPVPSTPNNDRLDGCDNVSMDIKSEMMDSDEEEDMDIDSGTDGGELLLNPLAATAAKNNEREIETVPAEKFKLRKTMRKKPRRGPHTHFRGVRTVKLRCEHCDIYLHSKWSHTQHMSRFHGAPNTTQPRVSRLPSVKKSLKIIHALSQDQKLNENEDVQDENIPQVNIGEEKYFEMIKGNPLTSVQENIISQLKTFSCYSCKQSFFDRRHTLNHIRQHMPDLRPYTCIACLTEFSDRSMYKIHCGASFECAMKIALVIPKGGSEKYFTCNMCLRPMPNRKELLSHLSDHSDKQFLQAAKLKTKPVYANGPKIRSPPQKTVIERNGPYMHGDPAHNHKCDLCGMIYRYKPNMFKHRELCASLPENLRTSYRCFHCNMTYLVFKKFHGHLYSEHKRRDIVCFFCHSKFVNSEEYLEHHEIHKVSTKEPETSNENPKKGNDEPNNEHDDISQPNEDAFVNSLELTRKPFNCALCTESFTTKDELAEHRNFHLKVKIYSCSICRSMFSSSGALEIHMKDHGIEDPSQDDANVSYMEYGADDDDLQDINNSTGSAISDSDLGSNHICSQCGKGFANSANLRRHQRNTHLAHKKQWDCFDCNRRFKSSESYQEHVKLLHTSKPQLQCPKCPKRFTYQGNLFIHCQNVHGQTDDQVADQNINLNITSPYQKLQPNKLYTTSSATTKDGSGYHTCDICGKSFREEMSLKTHRGWHFRVNYRTKSNNGPKVLNQDKHLYNSSIQEPAKSAKARKSFPNNPPQNQSLGNSNTSLQCQVCDDRFTDVSELRKHLWDVHCARSKVEKSFTSDLQCELCTNKFPDQESLDNHMEWHSMNPIFNNEVTYTCETCGKNYSNEKLFLEHKKLHKVIPVSMMNLQSLQTKRPTCSVCQKTFATENTLKRHKISHGHMTGNRNIPIQRKSFHPNDALTIEIKREPMSGDYYQPAARKKSVICSICKIEFPNMSVLYQHRQQEHSIVHHKSKIGNEMSCKPLVTSDGQFCCNVCGKKFTAMMNLKQHFSHKHKLTTPAFTCKIPGCDLTFSSANALKSHESCHKSMIFTCNLCDRHFFNRGSITKHMITSHRGLYDAGAPRSTLYSETDLSKYTIRGALGTACPKCKIKYPNLRALKIHYFKFHDKS